MNIGDPYIAIFVIMIVSFLLTLFSTLINKYFLYTPDYLEKKKFMDAVRKEYMAALRSKDEKQIKKLEKKFESVKRMQTEQTGRMIKPFIVTIGVFWIVYWWLSNVYKNMGAFMLSPLPIPFLGYSLNFFGWYILTSVWFGAVFKKIFLPEL